MKRSTALAVGVFLAIIVSGAIARLFITPTPIARPVSCVRQSNVVSCRLLPGERLHVQVARHA